MDNIDSTKHDHFSLLPSTPPGVDRDTSFTPTYRPILFYKNGRKFLNRKENWGSITYDFENDLFSASIKSQSNEIMPSAPLSIYWLLVAPCNLRCIHCYGNVEEFPKEKLSESDQLRVADEIINSGAMRVTLAGGEPLLRKDTPHILEKLVDNNISVVLGTNGTFLNKTNILSVKRANLVEISLDSHKEFINNAIRISRNKGNAYHETLKAIDLCLSNDVRLKILTCLNKHNYLDIEALGDFLYARGIRSWGLSWTLYAGRAKDIYQSHMPQDMELAEDQVQNVRKKYPDMEIKYSNRTNSRENNRFSFLIFANGKVFAEDLVLGKKIPFHSVLDAPLVNSWTENNFDIKQHLNRWVGVRIYSPTGGHHV